MNNRFKISKLKPLWIAISAVIIAAGILMFVFMGFNYSAAQTKTLEVVYNAVVSINEKEEELQDICETAFSDNGLKYTDKKVSDVYDTSYFSITGETALTYTFSDSASDSAIAAAKAAIEEELSGETIYTDVYVSTHVLESETLYEPIWRGAVAIASAVVAALIYIAVRFGLSSALTGLIACIHDAALVLALLAITRLPIYAYSPVLAAALAALLSLLLWMIMCMKMRSNFKDPAYTALSAEEAVAESYKTSWKATLAVAGIYALAVVVLGAVAASGVRLFMISALIPVVVCLYSSLVFSPAILIPFKAKSDRRKAKKRQRYSGKKKAEQAEE